jgi:hypothetical protein
MLGSLINYQQHLRYEVPQYKVLTDTTTSLTQTSITNKKKKEKRITFNQLSKLCCYIVFVALASVEPANCKQVTARRRSANTGETKNEKPCKTSQKGYRFRNA